jgi:hypothetical protein
MDEARPIQDTEEPRMPVGPGWLPAVDDPDPVPRWHGAASFPAVWRDTLPFTMGGLIAARDYPQIRLDAPWRVDPEPGSDEDVDQAIRAKLHVCLRLGTVLAQAQFVSIDRRAAAWIPPWTDVDELTQYAAEAHLPASPIYLDFETEHGAPLAWDAETWPLPFHLRGAVCWEREGLLSVVPFGSVGGVHPWGGTDYQAWARWVFIQDGRAEWPAPGPGDAIARADGRVGSWIDLDGESVCSQQLSVTMNLAERVLRVLWAIEAAEAELVPPALPRPERRRAKRAGLKIGLIVGGLPMPPEGPEAGEPDLAADDAMTEPCPFPNGHARLNEAHALWHEALDAYNDPEAFVTKLNALIQTLRNVTFALQKDIGKDADLKEWYGGWQSRMESDPRMRWAHKARNRIVKQGDLSTHSTARVRVVGELLRSEAIDIKVDPGAPVEEIARALNLPSLGRRALDEGILVVERRWTVDDLPDDELLDALAHCYGILSQLLVDAHDQSSASMTTCDETANDPCGWGGSHPGGRLACMWAGREKRTSRRDLSSGAPTRATVESVLGPPISLDDLRRRYGSLPEPVSEEAGGPEKARLLHEQGRQLLVVDKEHIQIVWLLRGRSIVGQLTLEPGDHREAYLGMDRVASEVNRLGADALIVSTEVWEALMVEEDDPRAKMRATEREDRREAFLTYLVQRDGTTHAWRSSISRSDTNEVTLGDAERIERRTPPLVRPVLEAWAEWSDRPSN